MQRLKERAWPRVYVAAAAVVSTGLAVYALAAPHHSSN